MSDCTGTPISWLRLERYRVGELEAGERDAVDAHLGSCAACSEVLSRIDADDRALPPLAVASNVRRLGRSGRFAAVAAGLALAAAVLIQLRRRPVTGEPTEVVDLHGRVKGTDVGFALVRDDDAVIADGGGVYRDGDRFKALVTCPPGMRATWDLVVYERGDGSFPLEPASEIACGNAVPLPGAFRVSGRERLTACLIWNDEGLVDREAARRTAPGLLDRGRCLTLDAAPLRP